MAKAGWTWRRRFRWAAAIAGALVGTYVGSYAALYRRGVAEADANGYPYIFYVPWADVAARRDTTLQHQILGPLYEPLNDAHRRWFGGRSACRCITFGLSAEPAER